MVVLEQVLRSQTHGVPTLLFQLFVRLDVKGELEGFQVLQIANPRVVFQSYRQLVVGNRLATPIAGIFFRGMPKN